MKRETKVVAAAAAAWSCARVEALEERTLMASTPWAPAEVMIGLDKLARDYPWLDGSGRRVTVIEQGMDVLHPLLGGNPATRTPGPQIRAGGGGRDPRLETPNVMYDPIDVAAAPGWASEKVDPLAAHGTGVAGLLIGLPTDQGGRHYQGMTPRARLFYSKLYAHPAAGDSDPKG